MRKILLTIILVFISLIAAFGAVSSSALTGAEFDMYFVKNGISKPTFFDVKTGLEATSFGFPPYTGTEEVLTAELGLELVIYATNYSLYLTFIDNTGDYNSGYMLSGADDVSMGNYNYSVTFTSNDVQETHQINVTDATAPRSISERRIDIFDMNSANVEDSDSEIVSAVTGSGTLTCTLTTPSNGFKQGQYRGHIVCVLTTE